MDIIKRLVPRISRTVIQRRKLNRLTTSLGNEENAGGIPEAE
jgi:hypothetical protein